MVFSFVLVYTGCMEGEEQKIYLYTTETGRSYFGTEGGVQNEVLEALTKALFDAKKIEYFTEQGVPSEMYKKIVLMTVSHTMKHCTKQDTL